MPVQGSPDTWAALTKSLQAARQWLRWHRHGHLRRAFGIALAVPTRVFEADVLQYRDLCFDEQLLVDFLAQAVLRALAARADLLVFGQVILDAMARQLRRQRLAATVAACRLIGLCQRRIRGASASSSSSSAGSAAAICSASSNTRSLSFSLLGAKRLDCASRNCSSRSLMRSFYSAMC